MGIQKLNSFKKKKRSGFPFLLVAIGVCVSILIGWQFYKYKIVNKGILKAFAEKTQNRYTLHYGHIELDELKGRLQIKNIEIVINKGAGNNNGTYLSRLFIPEINITGVKTPRALLEKQIEGRKIELSSPTIELAIDHFPKDTGMLKPTIPFYREILGNFLQIKFDSIQISQAHLTITNPKTQALLFAADNLSLLLSGLEIDSTIVRDSSRIFFSDNFDISCEELRYPTNDKQYRFYIDKIHFSSKNNKLEIGRLHLAPLLSEEAFSKVFRLDRFNFVFEGISFQHINLQSLWHKQIEADRLIVNKSSFNIYRDLTYPNDSMHIIHRYPQKQIQDIPFPVLIKQAIFVHSFIEYEEKNAKSDSSGKLQFFQAHSTIFNVTNRPDIISGNNKCTILFDAKLLDKMDVHAKVVLLLNDPHGQFSFEGNSGAIQAVLLNPLSKPMGLIGVERGNVKKCHFNFTATDSTSVGEILVLYDDLKMSVLKKNQKENKYEKKLFPDLAFNLILRKSNPGNNDPERVSKVNLSWKNSETFLNVIWNSIFKGMKKTIGIEK